MPFFRCVNQAILIGTGSYRHSTGCVQIIFDYFASESLCSFKHFVSFVSRIPEEFFSHAHIHNRSGWVCNVLLTSASSYGLLTLPYLTKCV
jgi:hypothetical protein